jgi:hypothetical protein
MKSEHRHELQTNELSKFADKVGVFFTVHGNRIVIGICVFALAASLLIYMVRSNHAREAAAWRDLANSSKADDFADVAKTHSGTKAAVWAQVQEGERRLSEGIQLMFSNVETGTKELELAKEALQAVVNQKGAPAPVRERALFGLARSQEALSSGTESEAVKTYETLLREFPLSLYKRDVESRIAALNTGSGQEFYAWFAKFDRPKPSDKRPKDEGLGEMDRETSDLINELRMQAPDGSGPDDSGDDDKTDVSAGDSSKSEEASPESKTEKEPEGTEEKSEPRDPAEPEAKEDAPPGDPTTP